MKTGSKKRFGQHFLRDSGVIERIVRCINPEPNDLILDIGAGHGALSSRLAPSVSRLLAVELDINCLPNLEAALSPFTSATVVAGDILHMNLSDLIYRYLQNSQKLRMVGNLPYNIATAIIYRLLHINLPISDMLFMVQLEVAKRITANPGSRQYGFLSVDCQHHADVWLAFKVFSACFTPQPKVTSAIVTFRPNNNLADSSFEYDFEMLAKAAFAHRRKTLLNALRRHPVFGNCSSELLFKAKIDGTRRAEDLSVREYEHLADIYRRFFRIGSSN